MSEQMGLRRHLITIEQVTETQTASGALNRSWSTFATAWAQITPTGGRERALGATAFPEAGFLFEMNGAIQGITTKMRINYNNRYFDILNINDMQERGISLTITAREGKSHGI